MQFLAFHVFADGHVVLSELSWIAPILTGRRAHLTKGSIEAFVLEAAKGFFIYDLQNIEIIYHAENI